MLTFLVLTQVSTTHCNLLALVVRRERLRLQNKLPPWKQVSVDLPKEPFEASVPPIKMNPFSQTQSNDDIILRLLIPHTLITTRYIIHL